MLEKEIEHALTIVDIKERYEYIYDAVCDYLDNKFTENNYCDFIDDKCVVNRKPTSKNKCMGCCYSFYIDWLMNMCDKKLCQHFDLIEKKCTTKCLPCKLYTCLHLEKQGVYFSIYNFPGLNKIFTKNQMWVLRNNCFKTKEQIIERLIEVRKSKMPHLLFSLFYLEKVRDKSIKQKKRDLKKAKSAVCKKKIN